MKSLYQYSRKKLIISIIMLLLSMLLLVPAMQNSLQSVIKVYITPDTNFAYTIDDLEEIREIYGLEGAKRYFITRFTYDLIWPAVYLYFIINFFAFLFDRLEGNFIKFIKILPFISVLFDLFENILCSLYFFKGQRFIGTLAVISSSIKWYLLYFIVILFVVFSIKKYIYSKKI